MTKKPKRPKRYYKVVFIRPGGDLLSTIACKSDLAKNIAVQYKPDVWTRPLIKNSRLFVYASKKAAADFTRNQGVIDHQLWECAVLNPKPLYKRLLCFDKRYQLTMFWKKPKEACSFVVGCDPFVHCATAVKLIRKVKISQYEAK
jgi:hypothetical protein